MSDDDHIETQYIKGGFATASDVVLSESATTRTVFHPGLSSFGVRGHVIRQKKGEDGNWKDVNEVDFRSVPADAGVSIELDSAATKRLFDKLEKLYQIQKQGVSYGKQDYVVAKSDEVVKVDDKSKGEIIRQLLDQGYSEEVWESLAQTDPGLATRLAAAQVQVDREKVITEFRQALLDHPDQEAFWQAFFEEHPWILQSVFSAAVFMLGGDTYVGGKAAKGRQGSGGVATDFIMADESTKSFAVVEIKTPETKLVGALYRGDGDGEPQDVYSPHGELSGGVVQVRNEIATAIEYFESVLGKTYKEIESRIHPKGVLIIGSSSGLNDRERTSFNHFRHGLYSLTVITFDELLRRLEVLFDCEEGPVSEGGGLTDVIF
jgi:antiviral defense system Shedu protein SduA